MPTWEGAGAICPFCSKGKIGPLQTRFSNGMLRIGVDCSGARSSLFHSIYIRS